MQFQKCLARLKCNRSLVQALVGTNKRLQNW